MKYGPGRCVVIDTNVLISAALLPQSVSAQALLLAVAHFTLAQNAATWLELQNKITLGKFDRYFVGTSRLEWMARLAQTAQFVETIAVATESRDASDNKFLGLALDVNAPLIVSGDQDLRVLHPYRGIPVLSPREFLDAMAQSPGISPT